MNCSTDFRLEYFRQRLGNGAQDAHVGVVIFKYPHAGETSNTFQNSQLVGLFPAVNALKQGGRVLDGNYDERVSGFESMMHRLQSIPCPGLSALAERVIENHGQIDLLRLVLRHTSFERQFVVGDDCEALGWNPIAFWRIPVTAKGNDPVCLRCARLKRCRA
jgi:hypothetical protein